MDTDRRRHERKLMHADAQMEDLMGRSRLPIRLLDISEGGIAFTTDEEVEISDLRTIEFSLPDYESRIRCSIRIANLLPVRPIDNLTGKYRVGAAFEQIRIDELEAIAEFIDD